MKIQKRIMAVVCGLGLGVTVGTFFSGCAGDRYTRSTGEYIDDHSVMSRVHGELGHDPVYRYDAVTVNVFRGTVQLGGFVFIEDQRKRAGEITKRVYGVRDVVNNIIVRENDRKAWDNRPNDYDRRTADNRGVDNRRTDDRRVEDNGRTVYTPAPDRTTGDYVDDKSVSAHVKSALDHDGEVKLDDVTVNTYQGTVQLGGFVNTTDQKSRAGDIAKNVPGVRDVANNITVKDKM